MHVVVVEMEVKPEHLEAFHGKMLANARASREREPGCRQFDVARDPARPGRYYLYEIYVDAAAFQAHLKTPHFLAFDQETRDMLAAKKVDTFTRVDPAGG